jgi:hypothetical protein
MNKKQLICMWCGIASIVFFGFMAVDSYRDRDEAAICICLVVLVTGGLIYTFKDRRDKKPKAEQKQ